MTLPHVLFLLLAGFGAGTVNAIAGGGSLITFPALLAIGLPAKAANVTNSIAVFPGCGECLRLPSGPRRVGGAAGPALALGTRPYGRRRYAARPDRSGLLLAPASSSLAAVPAQRPYVCCVGWHAQPRQDDARGPTARAQRFSRHYAM